MTTKTIRAIIDHLTRANNNSISTCNNVTYEVFKTPVNTMKLRLTGNIDEEQKLFLMWTVTNFHTLMNFDQSIWRC